MPNAACKPWPNGDSPLRVRKRPAAQRTEHPAQTPAHMQLAMQARRLRNSRLNRHNKPLIAQERAHEHHANATNFCTTALAALGG